MQIHWHEGLFLLPHHLQRFQHQVHNGLTLERRLSRSFPYGIIEARVSSEDLRVGKVRFDCLHAVLPSGTEVRYPEEAELPVLDIKAAMEESDRVTVSLAVPLWAKNRANCVAEDDNTLSFQKVLYKVVESEWADENTGENRMPILHRRTNATLVVGEAIPNDMEVIPLLRLVRSSGEEVGLPRQDTEFSGPCIVLDGSIALRDITRSLSSQVLACREELIIQINRGAFSLENVRGVQFEQLILLQTLNRAAARLETLLLIPAVPPIQVYRDMRDLLGDLSALHPNRDLFNAPAYDHDNPYPCFREIADRIRLFLRGGVTQSFLKVNFTPQGDYLHADLTDEHLSHPTDYFLGVRTKQDPVQLARFVENEDQFKLMPASLVERAVRGVVLKEERLPPLELPTQNGLHYFHLLRDKSPDVWSMIVREKSAIVRWTDHSDADYQVTLYMTVPPAT